ncbi:SH3 domain-containing protein 3-like [Lolium rigidum]|uniref:SH3 domain-containing protein 3-like n=1 Tax=Lolium rigidum TaxID=89674 RepID=UPI001F5CC6F8|nr:SH3 domain-containing protein 3-like [Lolium rigidum]
MEAFRKQANKFKEQVAKQQQAVIKQFSGTGFERSDSVVIDEVELQQHQRLEKLYSSTRSGRDFQKDIVRTAEGLVSIGSKHVEVGTKFSEDCFRYGGENIGDDEALTKAASLYGGALRNVEKEYEDFNRTLCSQTIDPLKAMAACVPLEDARGLAQRYSRMRQEAEILSAEIARRKARVREAPTAENTTKLQHSESRMIELKATMAVLGKEAVAALAAVESQQKRVTLQRLVGMVEAEKLFYLRLASILDDVEAEMSSEKQKRESAPPIIPSHKRAEKAQYFLAEAVHNFNGTTEKELSLIVGDYVVVRQIAPNGWAEGECRGKAGWFPAGYVERRENIPPNKVFPQA